MGRFRDALAGPGLAAIAEVKRRSPSAGELRPDADPARLASEFERAGASAVSILVDERFGGTFADVQAARRSTRLPLLAKGFFRDESGLQQAKDAGADAVLLLLRDLDDRLAATLLAEAQRLELDALVEAHDAGELRRAVDLGADPIGLNARDLGSFRIDRGAALELVAAAPRDRVIVAESGLTARAHGAAAELAGADAILVGSALMQASDPAAKLAELFARPLVKICGLTREEDVAAAGEAGADLAGFILAAETPRRAPAVLPVPETMLSVAVYVGEPGGLRAIWFSSIPERAITVVGTVCCSATASRWRACSISPGRARTRGISSGRKPRTAVSCSPEAFRRRTSARPSRP